jgi:hypothetical protein
MKECSCEAQLQARNSESEWCFSNFLYFDCDFLVRFASRQNEHKEKRNTYKVKKKDLSG